LIPKVSVVILAGKGIELPVNKYRPIALRMINMINSICVNEKLDSSHVSTLSTAVSCVLVTIKSGYYREK
jgi:energy-converting hydrogenase Eha subunit C